MSETCQHCGSGVMRVRATGSAGSATNFICGSRVGTGIYSPDRQSERCKLNCCEQLLTRLYGWDHMDTAADGPYWRAEMRKLEIKHPDPARVEVPA